MEPIDAAETSYIGPDNVNSGGDDSAASTSYDATESYDATDRETSHQSCGEATSAENSLPGVTNNEDEPLFVDPASPVKSCSGLVDSDEDEELPPISELQNWAQSQKMKISNTTTEAITIEDDDDDDDDDGLFVGQETPAQPLEDLVQPKVEDEEGGVLSPSPGSIQYGHAGERGF
jgi:hypothetical protein